MFHHLASLITFTPLLFCSLASAADPVGVQRQDVIAKPQLSINGIPFGTRAHWMRRARAALADLGSPCPFAAFGTAIVNHTATTADGLGELVCIGANANSKTGNPTMHG
ncbi:hypothetical protein DIS24_g12433 [Lasiodiplodia hormozganensis]|uniref:Uncharacterized protein n=1 Tax=Lasiodiplodia hormozganensis TaxID=869390 RepID=A0AA39TV38_9PEZI|nr:hypothetical protein DIS24_g12433 [Lasiodiplodia hormozganensis]